MQAKRVVETNGRKAVLKIDPAPADALIAETPTATDPTPLHHCTQCRRAFNVGESAFLADPCRHGPFCKKCAASLYSAAVPLCCRCFSDGSNGACSIEPIAYLIEKFFTIPVEEWPV